MVQPSESERLLSFVSELTGDAFLKVEESLGDGFVRLKVGEAERRQARHDIRSVEDIVIELLRNSRDAGACHIFIAFQKEGDSTRRVTVIDDGCGVPEKLVDRVFEPRVTSKLEDMKLDKYGVHGRGMALYSVRSTAKRAHIPWSAPGEGCVVSVTVDLDELPERKDQSTWPVVRIRSGSALVRGPHNVPRLVTEFKLEHPDVRLWLGSPAEVLSSIRSWVSCGQVEPEEAGAGDSETGERGASCAGASAQEIRMPGALQAIASATDARAVRRIAEGSYGIAISERNAHRIVAAQHNATEVLPGTTAEEEVGEAAEAQEGKAPARRLAKRLSEEDLRGLSQGVGRIFESALSKYFISVEGEPRVTRNGDEIRVSVRLRPDTET